MHYLIPQVILAVTLLGCLKVEKKNQDVPSEVTQHVQVYSQPQFILDEHMTLTEDTIIDAERVYLTKNAAIFAQNYNLKIVTQTFESEFGAVITHFGFDQVAAINQNGRDGGLIDIKATTAAGHLELIASGEKGGTGIGGWGPTSFNIGIGFRRNKAFETISCSPGCGKNSGRAGAIQFETYSSQNLKLSSQVFHSQGGDIGPTAPHYRAISHFTALNPSYKDRNQNCTEISAVGKPSYGGQICMKLQNQANFSCVTN